jgi:hypothetical protein
MQVETSPSPWHQGKANPHVVYGADQTSVCICNQGPSDAQLIAAAPMLLKVMRQIAETVKDASLEPIERVQQIHVWAEKAILYTEHGAHSTKSIL